VQKSLEEGFGLTVTEGMWKRRAVVASRVGGIEDQIEDGRSGLLVDARDLAGFGAAVVRVLQDRQLAAALGAAAYERAREAYLPPAHLIRYLELLDQLVAR
jgi:trehalose synthase